MSKLTVSLAGCAYDRTRAIFDGRVQIQGCRTIALAMSPEEAFHRAFRHQEFDITELSLSTHMILASRGLAHYAAIPVFPARQFRHSAIYVRADRGISRPEDLKGKIVGVPEYQMTAAVWVRGILQDEYGVAPASIRWRHGGLEQPGRRQKVALTLPPTVELHAIPDCDTLSQQLEEGKIDALVSPLAPSCFGTHASVQRLIPDYRSVEEEYYRRTRIFPIMHLVGIRKRLLEEHPWLAVSTYAAYLEAKRLCYANLEQIGHLFTTLPWAVAELQRVRELMGEDFWSYGSEQNAHVIETVVRYLFEQGLIDHQLSPTDLFVAATLDCNKV